MLRKCFFIVFLHVISSESFSQKLLTCTPSGGAWTKCALMEEFTFAKKQKFPWFPDSCSQKYVFSYTFPCVGNLHGLVFSAGLLGKPLMHTSDGATKLEFVEGPDDLRIIDSNPSLTRSATVFGSCVLNIAAISSSPSDDCIDQMRIAIERDRKEIETREKDLIFYNNTLRAIDQYCLFSSAYYLFESLGNLFLSQLSDPIRIEIKEKIVSIMPTLNAMAKNKAFTPAQRMAFFNIKFLASQMDDPSMYLNENGTPKKLEDFLTVEDRGVLQEMAKLNVLSDLERESLKEQILRKIGSTEEKIADLKAKISAWKETMEGKYGKQN